MLQGGFGYTIWDGRDRRQFGGCGPVGSEWINCGQSSADAHWDELLRSRPFKDPPHRLHDAVAGDTGASLFDEQGSHGLQTQVLALPQYLATQCSSTHAPLELGQQQLALQVVHLSWLLVVLQQQQHSLLLLVLTTQQLLLQLTDQEQALLEPAHQFSSLMLLLELL